MMEQEQLKPIREDIKYHNTAMLAQISPPKELTDASYERLPAGASGSGGSNTQQQQQPEQQQHSQLYQISPEKGPMVHIPQSFARPFASGEKRNRQVFDGIRPSQVHLPQQLMESDQEDFEDEEYNNGGGFDDTPPKPTDEDQHHLEEDIIMPNNNNNNSIGMEPTAVQQNIQQMDIVTSADQEIETRRLSIEKPAEERSIVVDPACGLSLRTNQNLNMPTDQYSPTIKSEQVEEKSPLGFSSIQNDQLSPQSMETMKSMDRSQMIGDEYCLLKDLGEGTFGNVKLGKHLSSGQLVAVKILEKKRITDQADVERVIREIKILKSIRHPNIIKLYEIIETKARIFLIMEYACGGELFDYIVRKDRLTEKEACRFYNQIVSGVEFLHSKGIAHRDLKPENLLLDKQKNLKIVDFGLSNTYKTGQTLKTACGSPCYAAPEMIAGRRYNGIEVDIWSSGVTLYAMLCGFLPFEDPDTALLYKKILKGDFELPDFLTNRSIKFLKEILCTDPEKRLGLKEIQQHPWLTQFDIKANPLLERTADNSRMMLSSSEEKNNMIYNTQIYGLNGGNSSQLVVENPQKEALKTSQIVTSTNIKPQQQQSFYQTTSQTSKLKAQNNSQRTQYDIVKIQKQYFMQANQTISSSGITATVTKPHNSNNHHHKSVSETQVPSPKRGTGVIGGSQGGSSLHNRPSTSLKKTSNNAYATIGGHTQQQQIGTTTTSSVKASKSHKRPKQQTTLSAIICSPRKANLAGSSSLKRSQEDTGHSQQHQHKSERKTTTNQNLKEKLRTLKKDKYDSVLTQQQQKQVLSSNQKQRSQKVPTAVSLLNNTMPMPKLMIDLASPSTGGSTDVVVGGKTNHKGTTTATSNQAQSQMSSKEIFKNNLARVAKNSAAAAKLQIHQHQQILKQGDNNSKATKKNGVSLKKQLLNQQQQLEGQRMMQQLITQSRSVIGGAAGSAHSSLSNKRKKSPRITSQNSSHKTVQKISHSASKAFPSQVHSANQALKTLNFENTKLRNKNISASTNFKSVHPYTVMAMPLHQSQNNLKETVLSQMSSVSKKSSNRHSLGGADPSLTKIPKAFVKSQLSLQVSRGGSSSQHHRSALQPTALLVRNATSKQPTQSHQHRHLAMNSVENQLRNVQIAISAKKAPNFTSEYSSALYSKAAREHRQVQSLEILKKQRNASIEIIKQQLPSMRTCAQSAVSPEWCTTEKPPKIVETLEALLPLLNVQFVHRKSPYLYEIKLARQMYGVARSVKCELELMHLKNAPFITVIRLNQNVKLKQQIDANEKKARMSQFHEFCRQLKHGLSLV